MRDIQLAVWFTGLTGFIFGISDRSTSILSEPPVSWLGLSQLFTAGLFATLWLILYPIKGE